MNQRSAKDEWSRAGVCLAFAVSVIACQAQEPAAKQTAASAPSVVRNNVDAVHDGSASSKVIETSKATGSNAKPSSSSGDSAPSAPPEVCTRLCALMGQLKCPHDPPDCHANCQGMLDVPVCKREMSAFMECASSRRPRECHCNEDGESEVRDGVCEAEQAKVAACLERSQG